MRASRRAAWADDVTQAAGQTFGFQMARQHSNVGRCEGCGESAGRPIYEVISTCLGGVNQSKRRLGYRYLCQACTEKFTHLPLGELCENYERFLLHSK